MSTEGLDQNEVQALRDLLNVFRIVQDYLNDQVIKDLCSIGSNVFKLVNGVSCTDLIGVFERALQDPQLDKVLLDPPEKGAFSLLWSLQDKDAQRGMGLFVELLKAVGRAARYT
jgi:uncharacterized protein YjgD (DUF1641 family)